MVRQHNYAEALPLLREASALAPDDARYAYVYAIALNTTGSGAEALSLLERTHKQHPTDENVLVALITLERDHGDLAAALVHAQELDTLEPGSPQIKAMIDALSRQLKR